MLAWKVDPRTRDLVFEGGSPRLIEGEQKLEQDLRWAIVTPIGSDRYNPNWGSRIPSLIGQGIGRTELEAIVQQEAAQAIRKYHQQVLDRINEARFLNIPGYFQKIVASAAPELIKTINAIKLMDLDIDRRHVEFEVQLTLESGSVQTISTAFGF